MNFRTPLIVTLLILGLFGGMYWYFGQKSPAKNTPSGQFPGESGDRKNATSTPPTETTPGEVSTFVPGKDANQKLPRLYELHKAPVAGVGLVETKDKKGVVTDTTARYIERGLGYIFEAPLSTYVETRIVNETRARLGEALWGNNGKSVVARFIDDKDGGVIRTNIVNIGDSTISFTRNEGSGQTNDFLKNEEVALPVNIPFASFSEDGADKIFYLEGGTGNITTSKNTAPLKIFSSAFTEWLPQFPNQRLITLNTRPSAKVPGHLFFLDPQTKMVTKILGNINGLTSLTSRNGKMVLYAETKGAISELSLYDVSKKEVLPLYLQSLPEKCVWGVKNPRLIYCAVPQTMPSASYPDQWYQGLVSFSDELWEINTDTLVTQKVFSPSTLRAPSLDMTNLSLSSEDAYLTFMNKITGTPWVYKMTEGAE